MTYSSQENCDVVSEDCHYGEVITLTMVVLLLIMVAMEMKIMKRLALTTLTWLFQVKCSPDSKGKPLKVTETFTVNTTTVQVITMLMLIV